jgi:hypothetical protein
MSLVGHRDVFEAICWDLPAITLLRGPASVGKWTLAEEVLQRLSVPRHNITRIRRLTVAEARALPEWASMASIDGGRKFIIARLDGASEDAQNMLLKFLEKPGEAVHVILAASTPVLPTIVSRSRCYSIGLLLDSQVEEILVLGGMDPAAARTSAPAGGGRVRPAREGTDPSARSRAVAVLNALAASSAGSLETAIRSWDDKIKDERGLTEADEAFRLLGVWAAEAAVGRWRTFTPDVCRGLTTGHARRVLGALMRYSSASPKVSAHAALGPLCTKA